MNNPFEPAATPKYNIQDHIEKIMTQFCEEGRWESIYLFSSEGLLMAGHETESVYGEENLLEFVFLLLTVTRQLGNNLPVKEITIRGTDRRILLFTYFRGLNDTLVLTAVTRGKRGYRRAMRNLIKTIQSLDAS